MSYPRRKDTFEVEPICKVLPIAPYTYHLRKAQQRDITLLSPRARHDIALKEVIMRIHEENYNVYGARAQMAPVSASPTTKLWSLFSIPPIWNSAMTVSDLMLSQRRSKRV